jgi:hypothetical protein
MSSSSMAAPNLNHPLALTADQGYGYFPGSLGAILNRRYEVSRMLGSGQSSSVFLVRDLQVECVEVLSWR